MLIVEIDLQKTITLIKGKYESIMNLYCQLSFAGYMFLRILFTLDFQVSVDLESCFMGNLEDRKMK